MEVDVSLPVKWKEDGRVSILAAYEFDDNEILSVYPEETFGSGRHILSLYYPLAGIVQERMHTFRVYPMFFELVPESKYTPSRLLPRMLSTASVTMFSSRMGPPHRNIPKSYYRVYRPCAAGVRRAS